MTRPPWTSRQPWWAGAVPHIKRTVRAQLAGSQQIVTANPAHVVTGCMADGSAAGQTYCRGDRAGKGEWSSVWNSEEHGGWLLE